MGLRSADRSAGWDPVRIGVVGVGGFGRLHALTLAGLGEAELTALVARRQASLDAVAGELPGVPGFLNLDRALEESDAEAWVVASSTESHVEITRRILSAGLPVLLEKPISATLSEAEQLRTAVAADSSNLMMGHILLFNTEFKRLTNEASNRGGLKYVSCVRHRPIRSIEQYPGENPFHLLMVHDLYSVQALVGAQEPVSFDAQVRRLCGTVVDVALAQLSWSNGLMASFTASFLTPDGMPDDGYDRMEVYGDGWAARIEPNPRPLTVWDDRERKPMTLEIASDPSGASGMLAEELRYFCKVVRGVHAVPAGARFEDAVQVMQWIDRLERISDDDR